MSYYPQKAKIGIPRKKNVHLIDNYKQSTTSFLEQNAIYKKRFYGNCSINFNYDYFIRLNPMPEPTMGQAYAKINWWYVPYRAVWKGYNYFRTKTLNPQRGFNTTTPLLNMVDIMDKLVNTNNYTVPAPSGVYDFIYKGNKYKFTTVGQQVYTILCQLGYNVVHTDTFGTHKYCYVNALPLLCFAKIVLDNYIPKDWQDVEYNYNAIYAYFARTDSYTIATNDVTKFLDLAFYAPMEDDYYVSAWKNPEGPNNSLGTIILNGTEGAGNLPANKVRNDVSNNGGAVLTDNSFPANNLQFITQQDLNNLKALDKYLKKNQIAGTKYWDRLLVHYGIKPEEAKLDVPLLISSSKTFINFGVVMSNAGTTQEELGEYAGQGAIMSDDNLKVNYETDADGYLIALCTITPVVGYGLGFDHDCLCITNEQFWNEEYDAKGTEPIPSAEIYSGYDLDNVFTDNLFEEIWGFQPTYAWDKTDINKITGKYNLYSEKAQWEKWTFIRWSDYLTWKDVGTNAITVQNNYMFGIGRNDVAQTGVIGYMEDQYERIFYYEYEHNFHIYLRINGKFTDLLKPLYDYEDIIEDDEKEVNIQLNTHE